MKHFVIYSNPEFYAGWPANHGAWQWGDEFLLGFMRGTYAPSNSMHKIKEPFRRVLYRSLDGGESWRPDGPFIWEHGAVGIINFEGACPGEPPPFDLNHQDTIIRACGVYDTGGDYTHEAGCFYLSTDRGHWWRGPYAFTGIDLPDDQQMTARTCTLGDLVFLSAGQKDVWGTDYTFVVRHNGKRFHKIGTVCEDDARAVMPAAARLGDNLVCLLRRRKSGKRHGWIDSFVSRDDGASWEFLSFVDDTGSHNGNPPALLRSPDDSLWCAYGNRDTGEIRGAYYSPVFGKWDTFLIRKAESDRVDVGYPRMFLRQDGKLVIVYYWTSDKLPQQHIAMTVL